MHTVELLEEALALAHRCGFVVRQDWLAGVSAGACEFQGRRWLFVDLAQSPREQLEQVLSALEELPHLAQAGVTPQLQTLLKLRKAA